MFLKGAYNPYNNNRQTKFADPALFNKPFETTYRQISCPLSRVSCSNNDRNKRHYSRDASINYIAKKIYRVTHFLLLSLYYQPKHNIFF